MSLRSGRPGPHTCATWTPSAVSSTSQWPESLLGKWADGLEPSSLDQVVDANFLGARPDGTGGAARILFTVGSADVADAVVRSRCGLKGSGSSIFEALSDCERAQHKALWPAYEAARAAGQKAQFRRARLFVVDANFLGARPDGTGGAARILFTVGSADVADAVVRSRCGLKGSGSSIFEALSDCERAQDKALWPAYEAARASWQKAQFRRARLFVDGLPVPAPAS
ncbi:hypothetical protein FOA52_003007 [Chlamydomonas sp. UWO 241]|nr:hypothetical protein FOA52_003007 [Chlamydomonas sp. UWO 241]